MLLYAVTIFCSAFLLFLVQPVMAKQILPWFGGSAAVWTTCLVFFQTTLLLGYAYSDAVTRRLSAKAQVGLHVALLAASCALLPIVPGIQWKPLGTENPSLRILGLLAAGSFLLLAVSNHICQNIASIPLLWIAPLSIYLLTFIICFDATRWYRRQIFLPMLAAGLGVMGWTLADSDLTHQLQLQIGVF